MVGINSTNFLRKKDYCDLYMGKGRIRIKKANTLKFDFHTKKDHSIFFFCGNKFP